MRRGSPLYPIAGMAVAFAGLLLWVSSLGWQRLDLVVLILFVVGAALSTTGCLTGRDSGTRRLGVVGLGANAIGAILLMLVYSG
jgi:hypothetical protein